MIQTILPYVLEKFPGTTDAILRQHCLCGSSSSPWEFSTINASTGLGNEPLDVSLAHSTGLRTQFSAADGVVRFPVTNADTARFFNDFLITNATYNDEADWGFGLQITVSIPTDIGKRSRKPRVGDFVFLRNINPSNLSGLTQVMAQHSDNVFEVMAPGGYNNNQVVQAAGNSITDSGSSSNGRIPYGNVMVGTSMDLSNLRVAYYSFVQRKIVTLIGTSLDNSIANAFGSRRTTTLDTVALSVNPIAANCPIHGGQYRL